jgi:hypothetical protein
MSVCSFLLSFSENCCLSPYQSIPPKRLTCEGADGLARPASIKRMPTPDVECRWNVILCKNMQGITTAVALLMPGVLFVKAEGITAVLLVMLLQCDIVQEHARHYYSCSPVNTGCTFRKSRRCRGTVFPVIIYAIFQFV